MTTTIVVAGATGNLGGRIIDGLLGRGAEVRALVRPGTGRDRLDRLTQKGVTITPVDLTDGPALAQACRGAACVVSALQGLRDVIVDAQTTLLEAAIAADVPRFIPSDFSSDFTQQADGLNRNLDLRRAFHERLDQAPIASTSILNGAFMELLSRMPLLDFKAKKVTCWGDPDHRVDFTTTDDTAAFTAAAALDPSTAKVLRIAGDQISARELAAVAREVTGDTFELVSAGPLTELQASFQRDRAADPAGESHPFPRWQVSQYLHTMFSTGFKEIDNQRYPELRWTRVRDLLAAR